MDARDLSFRAKRIDGEGWAYGSFVYESDEVGYIDDSLPGWSHECYAVHPRTLGMYTGFQDSKWLRIYDGDILKLTGSYQETDGSVQEYEEIHKIVYMNGCFYAHNEASHPYWMPLFEVISELGEEQKYEIIGNIHDREEDEND